MIRRTVRDSKWKKILQILAIYAFALIAAVACGQGFAPKPATTTQFPLGNPPEKSAEAPAVAAEFQPVFKKASKTVADGVTTLELAFADGAKSVVVKTQHSKAKLEDYIEQPIDASLYAVDAKCVDESCAEVVVGLLRSKAEAPEVADAKKMKDAPAPDQSFFLLAGPELQVKNELHKTTFDDIDQAFKALKPTP